MKIKDIKRIYNHPLNAKRKFRSVIRYFRLGLYMKLNKEMFVHDYVMNTKLLVGKKSSSTMLQYYNGLNDFEEMGFLLHFLRKGDLFVDVGANVGVYSILSSGINGTESMAIEPSKESLELLNRHIKLNKLENKVKIFDCAVGEKEGTLQFTKNLDAINRVVREEDIGVDSLELKVNTLDNLLAGKNPAMIKIDVEGFELNVIKGAANTLRNQALKAIIIETNGLSSKYHLNEDELHKIITEQGFKACTYDPFERKIKVCENNERFSNTIYVREIANVQQKILDSPGIIVNDFRF